MGRSTDNQRRERSDRRWFKGVLTRVHSAWQNRFEAASFRIPEGRVQALLASGTFNRQQAGSLKDEISAASNAAVRGDFATAVNVIEQFQADILALRNAGVLPSADWTGLNDAANIIINRLTSPFTAYTG